MFKSTCLVQAIAAQILYSHNGIPTDLHIGVKKQNGDLEAHAWIECNGEIVVGEMAEPEDYVRLYSLPAGAGPDPFLKA